MRRQKKTGPTKLMSVNEVSRFGGSKRSERKMVSKNIGIVIGLICIVLVAGLVGVFAYYSMIVRNNNNTISNLNSEVSDQNNTISALNSQITEQNNQISELNASLTYMKSIAANLQSQIANMSAQIANMSKTYNLQTYSVNVTWYPQYGNQSPMVEVPDVTAPFSHFIDVQGFSQMTILVGAEDMSEGTYTLSIELVRVSWYTSDFPPPNSAGWLADDFSESYNGTVDRYPTNWQIISASSMPIETKAPYAGLLFSCGATTAPGWAILDFYIYLRS